MPRTNATYLLLLAGALAFAGGCDDSPGGSGLPTGPVAGPATASVSIRASGFDPVLVVVRPGGEVTFTNRDSVPHEVASHPHPSHNQLPALNAPAPIQPGGTFRVTMPTNDRTHWRFHDDQRLNVSGFEGTISVCSEFSPLGC